MSSVTRIVNPNKSVSFHYDPVNKRLAIQTKEDCTEWVERASILRNQGESLIQKRSAFRHFAFIPNGVQYELMQKGIDIMRIKYDPAMRKRFLREIQYNYPHLKTTNKVHL